MKWNITSMQDYGLPQKPKGFLAITQNQTTAVLARSATTNLVYLRFHHSRHCKALAEAIYNPKSRLELIKILSQSPYLALLNLDKMQAIYGARSADRIPRFPSDYSPFHRGETESWNPSQAE